MKILLTSAGRRGYLVKYFKEVLGNEGEVHVANNTDSTAMLYGDMSVITPLIHDEGYIPFLKKYCQINHIDVIIPLFDIDLPILSKCINEFKEIGVRVIVSNEAFIKICNDKWATYNYLKKNGFYTPATFLNISDVLKAINDGSVHFPLIVKPRWGMGSISIFEADNKEELKVLYEKTKKNINSSYLSFESNQNNKFPVIIQEKLNGQEYGLDIINDLNGTYMTTVVKKKYAMRSGETDQAEIVINRDLELIGKEIGSLTGHIGNLDIDAFSVDGVPYVLEMNARFGGGYPFSHHAGVNLPKAIFLWLKNEPVEQSVLEPEIGVIGYKDIQVIGDGMGVATIQKLKEAINHRNYV
ncbi:ATP-grasp domain-containing protein [Psychrobacillus sp. NEAU-3TGS]|uniref:ATP-grasp domain-containing protein n=1 Tax=Psychrobacillus sp. NEAU-3TGS TaxID=2995412 RepID=UPI002496A4A2|nr:ATP-grasp domain-containing protein [Psychrobacillus sp. NEAU-3TGS]MDI2586530.1 ATP-grasp domain-containing protein [Psychrobacillus sp. NEAU-3TGS]